MRLSSKGRYGVRAMLDLAIHEAIGPVSIKNISQREGISVNYLEQIFNQLRRAELVRSIRGPGGGFLLARPPKDITVMDIIKALKVPVVPVFCLDKEDEISQCERVDSCVSRLLWQRLGDKIKEVLKGTSLEDLLIEARQISRLPQPDHKYVFQI